MYTTFVKFGIKYPTLVSLRIDLTLACRLVWDQFWETLVWDIWSQISLMWYPINPTTVDLGDPNLVRAAKWPRDFI